MKTKQTRKHDLYDSDTTDYVTPMQLRISREEYAQLIRESLECEQTEGHVITSRGHRVYAA